MEKSPNHRVAEELFKQKSKVLIKPKIFIPKIIIIEGCDKTGKSTLANELAERLNYNLVHLGVPEHEDHYQYLADLIESNKQGVIFDRFHWGDYVYGGITNKERLLDWGEFNMLEARMAKLGAIVIYCSAPVFKIAQRFKKDGEKLIPEIRIQDILDRYTEIARSSNLPTYEHDFESHPFLFL